MLKIYARDSPDENQFNERCDPSAYSKLKQNENIIKPNNNLRIITFTDSNTNVTISLDSPSETLISQDVITDDKGAFYYISYTLNATLESGTYTLTAKTDSKTVTKTFEY